MRILGRRWTFKELTASPYGLAGAAIIAYGGYYAWTRHQVHVVDALPYLLLGGCMVMHLFMHRGHGHSKGANHNHDSHDDDRAPRS